MRTRRQQIEYQQMELLCVPTAPRRTIPAGLTHAVHQLWLLYLKFWNFSTELRIQTATDRDGKVRWQVQDPAGDRPLWFNSEREVLIWLEERHHQRQTDSFREF